MKAAFLTLLAAAAIAQPEPVPNIPDLKLTTRHTSGAFTSIETVYFKGSRQRRDWTNARDGHTVTTTLIDCQSRRRIMLNHDAHTYAAAPIETSRERIDRLRRAGLAKPLPPATGPEVVTTIDVVDTGERRQQGRYTARHVVTTITVDAPPGARTTSTTQRRDGWYIDLPGYNCSTVDGWPLSVLSGFVLRAGESEAARDRERVEHRGRARLGFAIEESNPPMKIELVDFSEAPLDDALFTAPGEYRPALETANGGFDMTKPDTLLNRIEMYCVLWTAWVRNVFR